MSTQLHPNAAITALDSTASPLLRLPAELRNQIYGYVFTGPYKLKGPFHTITKVAVNERSGSILKEWVNKKVYRLTDVLPGVKTAAVVIEGKADWDTLNETRVRNLTKAFNVTLGQWMESDGAVQVTSTEK